MKRIILTLMILFSVSIFAEYTEGYITITAVKNGTVNFFINPEDSEPLNFNKNPLGIKDFEENSLITINYKFDSTITGVSDTVFELKYSGNRLSSSTRLDSKLTFRLDEIFSSTPSNAEDYFDIDFVSTYKLSGIEETKTIRFTFHYDTIPPKMPTDFKLVAGNENINVSWKYPDNAVLADRNKNMIYYKKTSSVDYIQQEVSGVVTSDRIKNLENEVEYGVYMVTLDLAGNESEKTEELTEIPVPVDDFYTYYRKSGGKEDGGYCFIATAAYGSYDDGMVKILRDFRDSYLPQSFIDTYYKYSPALANIIAKSKVLSFVTRGLLEPFVLYADFFLYATIWFKSLLLSFFMLLLFVKIRVRRIYYV